jgi:hypothetical protein
LHQAQALLKLTPRLPANRAGRGQADVAIWIVLIGSRAFPAYAHQRLTAAIVGTVIFESIGAPLTRRSLRYMISR